MKRRTIAAIALVATVAAGLAVHAGLPDSPSSDVAGDALYAVAAYLAVTVVAPRVPSLTVGIVALVWCVVIELFQLSGIPLRAGAAFPPAMLVLGTVFDPRDLIAYVVTVVVITVTDAASRAVASARTRRAIRSDGHSGRLPTDPPSSNGLTTPR